MTKKKIIIITIMAAMCCAVAALVSVTYGGKVKPGSDGAELYVDRDDTADSVRVMVAEHLTALGKAGWKCLGAFTGRSFSPKTGHYVLREGDNVIDVYKMLSRGHQTPVKLVVRSVRTPELLAGRLAGQLMADSIEIMRCLSDSVVCASYGFEPHTVIAMFLENSYEVYWNMSVRGLFDLKGRAAKEVDPADVAAARKRCAEAVICRLLRPVTSCSATMRICVVPRSDCRNPFWTRTICLSISLRFHCRREWRALSKRSTHIPSSTNCA